MDFRQWLLLVVGVLTVLATATIVVLEAAGKIYVNPWGAASLTVTAKASCFFIFWGVCEIVDIKKRRNRRKASILVT